MKRYLVAEAKRSLTIVVCLAMGPGTAILSETPARAQNQNSRPLQSSDLAKENLSRVAASAGEIKPVLLKDSGLMVELKRWVAKDATDHGQIITDADLTDDAIFYRLENDVEFRAVATLLLQKYGYLVPEVNPSSEPVRTVAADQERVKWITQEEEEARQQQHRNSPRLCRKSALAQRAPRRTAGRSRCEIFPGRICKGLQQNCKRDSLRDPSPNPTTTSNPYPNFPFPGQGTNPLERAQLMETGGSGMGRIFQSSGRRVHLIF